MIKVTALALFIALSNAEKETESNGRRLLQFGAPPQQQQQPGGYNPYGQNNFGSILNSPMCQYDPQNCIDMLQNMYQNPGFYPPPQPQPNPYYNPYQQYPQQPQYPPQPQVQTPPISQPPVSPAPPAGNPAPAAPVDPAAVPPATGVQSGPPLGPNGQPLPVVQPPPSTGPGTPPLGPNGQPLPAAQPPIGGQPGIGGQPPLGPPLGAPPMGGAPGFGAPPMGAPGLIPGMPGMPAMLGPPVTEVNCGPPPLTACAGRIAGSLLGPLNLGTNMANNFKLYCDTPGICSGSQINIDVRPNPAVAQGVRAIEQILCSEAGACQGTTANIKNLQGNGNNIELSNLDCSGVGGCNGFTLNGWGVSLNDVNCAVPGNCAGCLYNNMKTAPDAFCRDPFAPNAPSNPGCIIESIPCFGY